RRAARGSPSRALRARARTIPTSGLGGRLESRPTNSELQVSRSEPKASEDHQAGRAVNELAARFHIAQAQLVEDALEQLRLVVGQVAARLVLEQLERVDRLVREWEVLVGGPALRLG